VLGRKADCPIEVRFSNVLFPATLITLTSTADFVDGLQFDYALSDDLVKARQGDGWGVKRLARGEALDYFVHQLDRFDDVVPPNTFALSLQRGQVMYLGVSWTGIDGAERAGQLGLVWSYEDWQKGLGPFLSRQEDDRDLRRYMADRDIRLAGRNLKRRPRAKPIRNADIKRRIDNESRAIAMGPAAAKTQFVESLEIEGFRGFGKSSKLILGLPDGAAGGSGLTIVVGANNAGKSTIWESFDAIARKRQGDVSFSEGRRNRSAPNGIRLSMNYVDGTTYVVESQRVNTSETRAFWLPSTPATLPSTEMVSVPSRRYFQANFGKNVTSQRDWMNSSDEFSRFDERDQFTGRLFDLHNDEAKKKIFDELVAEVIGSPLEWSIDLADGRHGSNYYLKVTTAHGVSHSSEGLGDGIISLLFILNALYDSQPNTLLVIDEPELSLHPQLVKRLGRAIARFAATRQIVVLTHSPLLVSWDDVDAGAEIARVYKVGPDSRIAQVSRSVVAEVTKTRGGWKNPHVLGSEANEALFLDDEIIVVEGQEDSGLLPIVFSQAGVPQRGTVFGWGSGGGDGNPGRIAALLADLGFSKVVILLDKDKPDEVKKIESDFPQYLALSIPADDIRDKPATNFKGKPGLLDQRGKKLKPELVDETREVLSRVVDYFG